MIARLSTAAALFLFFSGAAVLAQTYLPLTGAGGALTSAPTYTGPGDIVASATAWWGLRAYNGTLAGAGASTTPVMDVKGSSSGSCTIYLLGNGTGGLDFSTSGAGGIGHQCSSGATTFCTVTNTSCTVSKLYDQTGNGLHITQSTAADQPTLNLSGGPSSGEPYLAFAGNGGNIGDYLTTIVASAINQPFSVSHVVNVTTTLGRDLLRDTGGGASIVGYQASSSNTYSPYAGTFLSFTANDNSWYAIQSAFNGSSSAFMLNGTDNTSQNPGTTPLITFGGDTLTLNGVPDTTAIQFSFAEIGIWTIAFSSGNRTNLNSNQRTYWGF